LPYSVHRICTRNARVLRKKSLTAALNAAHARRFIVDRTR